MSLIRSVHSARGRATPRRSRAAVSLLASLATVFALAGCQGSQRATEAEAMAVTGLVIMPDSTVLFGAEISTDPPTSYVSTDEEGQFWMTMPRASTYTFIATHPDARYRDMEGRITDVKVVQGQHPHLVIMIGRTQRMPMMDVGERAPPALRRGKKRTG